MKRMLLAIQARGTAAQGDTTSATVAKSQAAELE
jgi:hypothetical protein